jgi:TonB family protein
MNNGGLKWFFALSVTVHAVVLVTWTQPETLAGNPGKVINLEVVEMAGAVTAAPAGTLAGAAPQVANSASQPVITAQKPASATRKTSVRTLVDKPAQVSMNIPVPTVDEPSHTTAIKPLRTAESGTARPVAKTETVVAQIRDPLVDDTAVRKDSSSATVIAGSPERSREEADRHLRNTILELFASNLKYPPLARRKGWQGIVILALRIESNGRISRLHVNGTSGYPVLDRAAVESLQLASVPRANEWLNGEAVDIIVPVEYRLVDS